MEAWLAVEGLSEPQTAYGVIVVVISALLLVVKWAREERREEREERKADREAQSKLAAAVDDLMDAYRERRRP